jgi:hypothetical protein
MEINSLLFSESNGILNAFDSQNSMIVLKVALGKKKKKKWSEFLATHLGVRV